MSGPLAIWKTAHVLSAAILFGSGLGTAFFCWFGYRAAMRSGDVVALREILRLTVIADAWLTAPAVVFQAASGLFLMKLLGWPYVSVWSMTTWSLFVLVGASWLPVVFIQLRLHGEAKRAESLNSLPVAFHRLFRLWFALGVPAFTAVAVIVYLMVAKPLPVAGS